MAKLKVPIVINSEFIKKVVQGVTASVEFESTSSEDYKKGFFDFAETLVNTLEKINNSNSYTPEETPCDRCKHFYKEATQYPCSCCRNCYTSKFELDEERKGADNGS